MTYTTSTSRSSSLCLTYSSLGDRDLTEVCSVDPENRSSTQLFTSETLSPPGLTVIIAPAKRDFKSTLHSDRLVFNVTGRIKDPTFQLVCCETS